MIGCKLFFQLLKSDIDLLNYTNMILNEYICVVTVDCKIYEEVSLGIRKLVGIALLFDIDGFID